MKYYTILILPGISIMDRYDQSPYIRAVTNSLMGIRSTSIIIYKVKFVTVKSENALGASKLQDRLSVDMAAHTT